MEFLSIFSIILPIIFGIVGYKVPWQKQKYFLVVVFAVNLLLVSICSMQQGLWTALEFSHNLSIQNLIRDFAIYYYSPLNIQYQNMPYFLNHFNG